MEEKRPLARSRMVDVTRTAVPPLLFGLRLWASVCLALYIAFWLELDNAYWAGTSAAIMCQPRLGASLRKGWFRMIGTVIGAIAIVVLTAFFPQQRAAFLVGLALWGATCAAAATLLKNFAAYAAALAGYTAAIVAYDQLGATGGPNGQAFMLAVTRATEVCIGIVSAGLVLAVTDLGGAQRRLAESFGALTAEISGQFVRTLRLTGASLQEMRPVRRELVKRVIALDPVIDEAIGESSQLRDHSPMLQAAVDGLFEALSGWRTIAAHLESLPDDEARGEGDATWGSVPSELRAVWYADPARWMRDPTSLRGVCDIAVRTLSALPAGTPALRLLADQTARVLNGLSHALDGLALLVEDPVRPPARRRRLRLSVPDWLPSLVSAGRAFVTICAVAIFWIVTAWPSGALAITWAAIPVILFSPRADQAYGAAAGFMAGNVLAAVFAAIVAFAVLPSLGTFAGFAAAMGLYLVPVGALLAQRPSAISVAMAANFVPLLAPANHMSYDTIQFYNTALGILAGNAAAALFFRLLPPLSPALRTRRLLAFTLRDLRRLATGAVARTARDWEQTTYGRLEALPHEAEPLQRARLLAALSLGTEIVRLRHASARLGVSSDLGTAIEAFAEGKNGIALAWLDRLDGRLASRSGGGPETTLALSARGSILAISEVLAQHASYFDAGART